MSFVSHSMDAVDAWRSLSRLGTAGSRLGREMNPHQMQPGFSLADRSSIACESRMSSYGPVNFLQSAETVDGQQMHLSKSAHHRRRKKGPEYPMVNLDTSHSTHLYGYSVLICSCVIYCFTPCWLFLLYVLHVPYICNSVSLEREETLDSVNDSVYL